MSDSFSEPDFDEQQNEVSWTELIFGRSNTLWFLLMAIGFLAFELTAQPALVAVAVCSKFGIPDLLNGLWLRRTDPLRARGKICFWFCLSQGLWKTTMVAFVAMLMFIAIAQLLLVQNGQPPAGFVGTAMTFVMSFITASLTTWMGFVLARTAGHLIWIDENLKASRKTKTFPPQPGTNNRVRWLLAGSMILPIVIFLMTTLIVANARPNAIGNAIGLLVGLLLLPVAIITIGLNVAKIVVAKEWEDCWLVESKRRGKTLREVAAEAGVIELKPDPHETSGDDYDYNSP